MKNFYALALEGDAEPEVYTPDPNRRTVVTAGPLGQQITDELNRQFVKVDNVTGDAMQPSGQPEPGVRSAEIAQESQQQDVTVMQNLVSNLNRIAAGPEQAAGPLSGGEVTVYGVSEVGLDERRVVEITSELASRENPRDFVVVVQPEELTPVANTDVMPIDTVEEVSGSTSRAARPEMVAALESICKKMGGKVYTSLENFCSACEDEAKAADEAKRVDDEAKAKADAEAEAKAAETASPEKPAAAQEDLTPAPAPEPGATDPAPAVDPAAVVEPVVGGERPAVDPAAPAVATENEEPNASSELADVPPAPAAPAEGAPGDAGTDGSTAATDPVGTQDPVAGSEDAPAVDPAASTDPDAAV